MGKKVTVISTSLRHGSNSAVLADAFAMGASEAGNEVTLISLTGKDIHFCTGCLACQKTGKCVIHDDMNVICRKSSARLMFLCLPRRFIIMK